MKSIIFDGAFGTYYNSRNPRKNQCEMANINDQETIYNIHKEYVDAGVDAIKTNTFGANSMNYPDRSVRNKIIKNGFNLAMMAVKNTSARVFADIGNIEEDATENQMVILQNEYLSIAQQFLENGASEFIFETLSEYEAIVPAINLIKSTNPKLFIITSFAVSQDGYTRKGLFYKTLLKQSMENPDIDVCGLNCICGPSHILRLLTEMKPSGKPLCAMPNAGYPATVNGRTVYQDNAGYFASKLNEMQKEGISYLGGCCGTTPEHMKQAVELIKKRSVNMLPENMTDSEETVHEPEIGLKYIHKNHVNFFKEKLASGDRVIAVELDPPVDTDVSSFLDAALKAKKAGADIITISDSPLARTRVDSILLAAKVKREIGIDALAHLSCRDRNHIGLKGSLLGASIENINNILVITGDPISRADKNEMKGVFSFNSYKLISFIKSLNEEVLQYSPIHIAAALNVNSNKFDVEMKRAMNKIDNGAELFMTQPLFSDESTQKAIFAKKSLHTKILFGIMPVTSYKNALFLNNEVSGIHIPDIYINELYGKSTAECEELAARFSMDIINTTKNVADGYYLMASLKKIDMICRIIRKIISSC
ncbi:MAG: bifunctional homocysteine S-methyltransferase/methylenetetrahydrofolate reductase [Saccharofermentanales bacterium]